MILFTTTIISVLILTVYAISRANPSRASCTTGNPPTSITPHAYAVLAIINRFDGELRNQQRLQKLVFLLDDELGNNRSLFTYKKYDYGPFAHQLKTDLRELERVGFIEIDETRTLGGNTSYTYVLTETGENVVREARTKNQGVSESLDSCVNTVCSEHEDKSVRALIQTVRNSHYDEYWKNSVYRR